MPGVFEYKYLISIFIFVYSTEILLLPKTMQTWLCGLRRIWNDKKTNRISNVMSSYAAFNKNKYSDNTGNSTSAYREYASILSFGSRILEITFVGLGFLIAYYLKFDDVSLTLEYKTALILVVLLVMLIFPMTGLYRSWRGKNWFNQSKRMTLAWLAVGMLLIVIGFFTKSSASFSREWMINWWLMSWVAILAYRYVLVRYTGLLGAQSWGRRKVAIVGAGELGKRILRNLSTPSWSEYEVVGFVDDNDELVGQSIDGVLVKGKIVNLNSLVEENAIDEIIITLPLTAINDIENIQYQLRHSTVTIRLVPDIYGLRLVNQSVTRFAGLHVLNLTETPMFGVYKLFKVLQDKILSFIILILCSPLLLFIACGVKLSSKGPILYKQERVSWNGESFWMYKFRSMPVDVEDASGPTWSKPSDNRATRFGAFLRRTSLDELPQFLNVLKGDMSIVGPRPERPHFVDNFKDEIPKYMQRHLVKAGITGWAQVNGWRGNTDLKKRIECDIQYIENWTLSFDFKIIFLTIFKGFVNKNAY